MTSPEPSRIWSRTTFSIAVASKPCCRSARKASSRFGPIVPLVPAAASVWQAEHWAVPVKSFWPFATSGWPGGGAARATTRREQRSAEPGSNSQSPAPHYAGGTPPAAPTLATASSRVG